MQMWNDLFPAYLSKFVGKMVDDTVYVEFVVTYTSKNENTQDFLNDFAEEFQSNMSYCLRDPEWENIKFKKYIPNVNVKFDEMDIRASLTDIKITRKETQADLIYKYDMTFIKKQEVEIDTHLNSYLKHKEEDEDGKKCFSLYDVTINRNEE